MSINFSMGFSCGDDFVFDKKENEVVLIDERQSRETRLSGVGVMEHAESLKLEEFWPVEHPLEPQDEDRPVKCPMHSASSLLNDSRMQEDSFRKRAEVPVEINREGIDVNNTEAPIRAVRKRHHTHTNDDHNTDLMRMPPLPSLQMQTQKITIFEMLQDFDQFES